MLYLLPHGKMGLRSHETEETYVIISGTGTVSYWGGEREVAAGDFIYLPACWQSRNSAHAEGG